MGEWEEEVRKLEERSALAEVTAVVCTQKSATLKSQPKYAPQSQPS